jgi:DNA mismatch repair protein MSH2
VYAQEHEESLSKYVELVESTIDLEELNRHNFVIKPEYDPGLQEISEQLGTVRGCRSNVT